MLELWRDFIIDLQETNPELYKKHTKILDFAGHRISIFERTFDRLRHLGE